MATGLGLLAVLMWGLLALLGSFTSRLPPFQLLALCFMVSTLIMFARRLLVGEPLFVRPRLSVRAWLLGVGALFGFHASYFIALRLAPVIEVSLTAYLWPLLLSLMVARSGQRLWALVGGVIGFTGVGLMMVGRSGLAFNSSLLPGYLFALTCALIWSTYSWYLARSAGRVDDIGWYSLAVSLLALITHGVLEQGVWQLTGREWLGVLLLGLGPVGGAFYLWDIGLKHGHRQLLASLSYGAPLISAVALALFGLNDWSSGIVLALVLITIGSLVAVRRASPPRGLQSMK